MPLMTDIARLLPLLKDELANGRIEEGRLIGANGEAWPVFDGAPNLLDFEVGERSKHISHAIPQEVMKRVAATDGLVLNLSAGGTKTKPHNVVELEWGLYGNTDISADAHDLPFADSVFDAVICLNSFEHYHSPQQVVSEMKRVLKPGGWIYVLTAFLQPMHMQPHHYFNATPSGVRKWFEGWDIERCGATEFHNVMLALQWIAASAMWAFEKTGAPEDLKNITLDDLRRAWQGDAPENVKRASALASKLPQAMRDGAAQAIEIFATKPAKVSVRRSGS